jgi:hypothetical protein
MNRDYVARCERPLYALKIVRPHRPHVFQNRLPVEDGIGERHASPGRRRLRVVVDDDAITLPEQAMGYRRPDVANAAHKNPQCCSQLPPR